MTGQDLTNVLLDALGKRIEEPGAVRLAEALGKKAFKSATPDNQPGISAAKLGLEVGTHIDVKNRALWPPRKQGRLWVTYVTHAFIRPNYRGAVPQDFDWQMDDAALSARFERRVEGAINTIRFTLPPPRGGLKAVVELASDGRPRHLYLAVDSERAYATVYPGAKREHTVEAGFFAAWCALEGVLREERLDAEQQMALRARRMSPHAFLSGAVGGLLWQADVKPEFDAFCHAYMNELMDPREAAALGDIREIFGQSNYWRTTGEPLTQDSWTNYDRIAPRYAQRLAQWQRGEITSVVDGPR
ncbi:MAG: hypothetical protein GY844_29435 [Bradyrhizobium sp.]|nr:hypothetical protein [Bradyrhizobium sp.]